MRFLILVLLIIHPGFARIKLWNQNVNLGNPDMWELRRLPCKGQSIALPQEVISLPSSFNFGSKLLLPNNGMLLFPDNGSYNWSSSEDVECSKSKIAKFNKQKYNSWFDPDNWATLDPDDSANDDYRNNTPVPHGERIPCKYDDVMIPRGVAPKIALHHKDVDIGSFSFSGLDWSAEDFRALYSSGNDQRFGKMMIFANTSLSIHGEDCDDPQGCLCGHEDSMELICSMKGSQCPTTPKCSDPLKPRGHCCYDVCGAVVHIEMHPNSHQVRIELIRALVKANILMSNAGGEKNQIDDQNADDDSDQEDGIFPSRDIQPSFTHNNRVFMSRVSNSEIQIVIVSGDGDVGSAIGAARDVFSFLDLTSTQTGTYIWMEESGIGPPSALKTFGKVMVILLSIAGVICFLYFLVYLHKTFSKKSSFLDQLIGGDNTWKTTFLLRWPSQSFRSFQHQFFKQRTAGFEVFENESSRHEMRLPEDGQSPNRMSSLSEVMSRVNLKELEKRVKLANGNSDAEESYLSSFVNPMWDHHEIVLQVSRPENTNHYTPEPIKNQDHPDGGLSFQNKVFDLVDITKEAGKVEHESFVEVEKAQIHNEPVYESIGSMSAFETDEIPLIECEDGDDVEPVDTPDNEKSSEDPVLETNKIISEMADLVEIVEVPSKSPVNTEASKDEEEVIDLDPLNVEKTDCLIDIN